MPRPSVAAVAMAVMVFVKRVMAVSLKNGAWEGSRRPLAVSSDEATLGMPVESRGAIAHRRNPASMSAARSASAMSSGDLRADRRFLCAEESAAEGDYAAAAE